LAQRSLYAKHCGSSADERGIDADRFPAQNRGMAKKAAAKVEQASSLSPKKETGKMPVPHPSSLLDTRVIYCGDKKNQRLIQPFRAVTMRKFCFRQTMSRNLSSNYYRSSARLASLAFSRGPHGEGETIAVSLKASQITDFHFVGFLWKLGLLSPCA
jgi:hypothetical protein